MGGVFRPKILVSRNVSLKTMKGAVIVADDVPVCGIKIGFGNIGIIDRVYDRSIWENNGTVEFKGKATIGLKSRIACSGHLTIGADCHFNGGSDIICWDRIDFGAKCLISWGCLFMDTDFHDLKEKQNPSIIINPDQEISIGNHVWIGCRTTVLKGASISNNSVVAACSVVTKELSSESCVYVGNKCVKDNIMW